MDLIALRDAAGVLALQNGTNSQNLRICCVYTDSTHYSAPEPPTVYTAGDLTSHTISPKHAGGGDHYDDNRLFISAWSTIDIVASYAPSTPTNFGGVLLRGSSLVIPDPDGNAQWNFTPDGTSNSKLVILYGFNFQLGTGGGTKSGDRHRAEAGLMGCYASWTTGARNWRRGLGR